MAKTIVLPILGNSVELAPAQTQSFVYGPKTTEIHCPVGSIATTSADKFEENKKNTKFNHYIMITPQGFTMYVSTPKANGRQ